MSGDSRKGVITTYIFQAACRLFWYIEGMVIEGVILGAVFGCFLGYYLGWSDARDQGKHDSALERLGKLVDQLRSREP